MTTKDILKDMQSTNAAILKLEGATFDQLVHLMADFGQGFKRLMAEEGPDATANGVWTKHEKALSAMRSKTSTINEAFVFAQCSTSELNGYIRDYRKVGRSDKVAKMNGRIALRMDFLASCITAHKDKRWDRNTGKFKATSNAAKTPAKVRAEKEAKVVEWTDSVGITGNADWDPRFIPTPDLEAMIAALQAEIARREAHGKVYAA